MLYSNLQEQPAHESFEIADEQGAQFYEDMQTTALGYYRAKAQYFDDAFENQVQTSTLDFMQKGE